MHAQGADMRADDTFVSPRCADVMERLRGSEDIARDEANEDMLAAVLPEWGMTGSSARGAHQVIGTAPPAQAGGVGHTDARVEQATPPERQAPRKSWQTSTRRGMDGLRHRQSPPLRDPLHGRVQASPRDQGLHSGNRFAALAGPPDQEEGNAEAVQAAVDVGIEPSGNKAMRSKGPYRAGNRGQARLPHEVFLGDFLPENLTRASKWRNRGGDTPP